MADGVPLVLDEVLDTLLEHASQNPGEAQSRGFVAKRSPRTAPRLAEFQAVRFDGAGLRAGKGEPAGVLRPGRKPWVLPDALRFCSEGSVMSLLKYTNVRAPKSGTDTWRVECWKHPNWKPAPKTREEAVRLAHEHVRQHHTKAAPRGVLTSAPAAAKTPAASAGTRPCHICGSTAIKWKKTNKLAKTLFLTPALLMKKKPHCASCGAVRQA